MTKLRKKTNRGSLMVLVVIMAAGGVLRLGSGIGQALALTAEANVPDGIGNESICSWHNPFSKSYSDRLFIALVIIFECSLSMLFNFFNRIYINCNILCYF